MVMFGAIWQYIDKSNELTKEQILTHVLMGDLEEKKAYEKEREVYLLKAHEATIPPQKKWLWF